MQSERANRTAATERSQSQTWWVGRRLVDSSWLPRLAAAVSVLGLLAMMTRANLSEPGDFSCYLDAAIAIRDGQSPYAVVLAWKEARFAHGIPGGDVTHPELAARRPYVYPPLLAIGLLPLTSLDPRTATAIWLTFLVVCFLCIAWVLADTFTPRGTPRFWLLLAAIILAGMVFKPIRGALTYSKQADVLILLLLTLVFAAFAHRRVWWVAIWLGLAVAIKPFVAFIALLLFWKRAYREAVGAAVISVILGLGPLIALGQVGDFVNGAPYLAGPEFNASPVGQSLYAFLLRTLTVQPYTVPLLDAPWLVTPLRVVLVVGLMILLLTVVGRSRDRGTVRLGLEFGLTVATMLLLSPLTEESHLAYLLIGLLASAIVLREAARYSVSARATAVVATLTVGLLALPGTTIIAWGWGLYSVDGPLPPPLSFVTFIFLYGLLSVAAVNLIALLLTRQPSSARVFRGNGT